VVEVYEMLTERSMPGPCLLPLTGGRSRLQGHRTRLRGEDSLILIIPIISSI